MSAGVECRVPYLARDVVDFVTTLPLQLKVETLLGIQKYVLKRLALEKGGPGLIDPAIRPKLGVPSTGLHHETRFAALCEHHLPADFVTRHPLGPLFSAKHELLMFELFGEAFLNRRASMEGSLDVVDLCGQAAAPRRRFESSLARAAHRVHRLRRASANAVTDGLVPATVAPPPAIRCHPRGRGCFQDRSGGVGPAHRRGAYAAWLRDRHLCLGKPLDVVAFLHKTRGASPAKADARIEMTGSGVAASVDIRCPAIGGV